MTQVRVKICGITSKKDLKMVVEAGADAVGFVVDAPKSKRNLSVDQANKLIESTPIFVESVVVVVPKDLHHLKRICEELNPSLLQIHGGDHLYKEIEDRVSNARVIGTVKAKSDVSAEEILNSTLMFDAVLIDSHVPGRYGGTGKVHDWKISKRIRELLYPRPLILAGGLSADNVKEAIETVRPYAVDVSTGVESRPGKKDHKKVNKFINNAKEV